MYRIIKHGNWYAIQVHQFGDWLPHVDHIERWFNTERRARDEIKVLHKYNVENWNYPEECEICPGVVEVKA